MCGTVPSRLFDTQVAAGFVGYSSVGLSGLVQGLVDIKLPKADRLTDWLARPLPAGAVESAASDVAHLHELHRLLVADLESRGRLPWALDECELQRTRASSSSPAEHSWGKITEAKSMRGRAQDIPPTLPDARARTQAEVDG